MPAKNTGVLSDVATNGHTRRLGNGCWRMLSRLDPTSLKLFIAVIEEGTIAAAAAREHLVPAAVSQRLTKLETALQTQLVRRTHKGLEPTDAGIALVSLARQVLVDLEEIGAQMHEYSVGIRGQVRIAANIAAISQFLPGEIRSFLTEHPHVRVQVEEKTSAAIAKAVAENAAHLGILTMGLPHGQPLETFPYRTYRLVVVTPNRHPLAGRESVMFEETLDFDYVGLKSGSAIRFQLLKTAAELNRTLRLRAEVSAYDVLCLMVEADLGIGIMAEAAAQPYVNAHRICAIDLNESWATRELQICVRSFSELPVAAQRLATHLRQGV